MSGRLEAALRSDLALLSRRRQERLIHRARELYGFGFEHKHIRPSQMAAVGELIRRAASFEEAAKSVGGWMGKTLKKLEARRDRTGKVESWLRPASLDPFKGTILGQLLIEWITDQRYLEHEPPPDLDRLAALHQFWDRFHGLYRYRVEMGEEMPLHEQDTEKKS